MNLHYQVRVTIPIQVYDSYKTILIVLVAIFYFNYIFWITISDMHVTVMNTYICIKIEMQAKI